MKAILISAILIFTVNLMSGQMDEEINQSSTQKLTIKGYGQIDFNQQVNGELKETGTLDVHRLVMMFGYKFNKSTSFVSEIEYEHVSEVYIEQAYLNHKFSNALNLKAGLLLIPMGIINEYHEPPTFNGVERPNLDKYIAPTTWREIGVGISGRFDQVSLKYQLYVVNGFLSYSDGGKLSGKNGLRKGRQKGAESVFVYPNFTGKLDYYGISGLKVGLSGYFGKTQSTLFDGLDTNDDVLSSVADSSVVGISMIGADFRYGIKGFSFKGQYYLCNLSNTDQYNTLTDSDLGSTLSGYYLEAGYNVLSSFDSELDLIPFIRYENYNTHATTAGELEQNPELNKTEITAGIGLKLAPGAVLKADMQFVSNEGSDDVIQILNLGVGIWF
jgi:hypothetical protein